MYWNTIQQWDEQIIAIHNIMNESQTGYWEKEAEAKEYKVQRHTELI